MSEIFAYIALGLFLVLMIWFLGKAGGKVGGGSKGHNGMHGLQ